MRKLLSALSLVLGTVTAAMAVTAPPTACTVSIGMVPEIDAAGAAAALTLVACGVLIIRGRRRKS
jgi:hypothetical protein